MSNPTKSATVTCPRCGGKAKRVDAVTLESLLAPDALADVGDATGYWHCPAQGCDVAYFHPERGVIVDRARVGVRIGTKETSGPRPVCYCFGHSWESIESDLRARGSTDVVETITEHCRKGEDRCPETNPQGSCCLGNVRRAVAESKAKLRLVEEAGEPADDCCAVPASDDGGDVRPSAALASGGVLAAGGAVVAAVLSSVCCWLPLLLVALGAGTSTIAGALEAYRGWLLGGTAALLGAGFYFVYFKKPECAPGSACEVPRPRLALFNKITLWTATALVATFAFFPTYIGAVLDVTRERPPAGVTAVAPAVERSFLVDGMTCEACTASIRGALESVAGVASAAVSYEAKLATVRLTDASVDDARLLVAIAESGYLSRPATAALVARRYDVEGMTCESCTAQLAHALRGVPGVRSAAASYREALAIAVFEAGHVDDGAALEAIRAAGYSARVDEEE